MFSNYTLVALIHVVSLLLYQEFGSVEFMAVSALCIIGSLFWFLIGVGTLVSPEVTIEINDEEYERQSDYFGRGALQVTVLIIAYVLWQEGYDFISGVLTLQATTILISCIISLWVQTMIDDIEEEGDDE